MKELLEKLAKGESTVEDVLKAIDEADKEKVPRSRLNDKNEEIKELKAEIKQRDTQIDDLQKSVKGNEELTKQIEDLKKANDDWQGKYKETQLNTAIKLAAKGAKDANDILAFIKKDGLELLEDGTVKGLEEALKGLKESKPYLFEEVGLKGRKPNDDPTPPPTGVTKEQFGTMSYSDRVKLYNENPDLYKQLSGGNE
jgi:myosin heavy subunit